MRWSVEADSGIVVAEDPYVECSFEVGDWHSFLSLGGDSLEASHTLRHVRHHDRGFEADHDIRLKTGSAVISQRERFWNLFIERQFSLTPTSRLQLGDFVVRFVFDATEFTEASIGGNRFEHRGRNRYLQYPSRTVRLHGVGKTITITGEANGLPSGMDLMTYARDESPDRWVVHLRALVRDVDLGFLRLYRGPWSRIESLDRAVERLGLDRHLLYCRERASKRPHWPTIPFQYVRYVELQPDENLEISAECTLESGAPEAEG